MKPNQFLFHCMYLLDFHHLNLLLTLSHCKSLISDIVVFSLLDFPSETSDIKGDISHCKLMLMLSPALTVRHLIRQLTGVSCLAALKKIRLLNSHTTRITHSPAMLICMTLYAVSMCGVMRKEILSAT